MSVRIRYAIRPTNRFGRLETAPAVTKHVGDSAFLQRATSNTDVLYPMPEETGTDAFYLSVSRAPGHSHGTMFWMHGGSLVSGSAGYEIYDGDEVSRELGYDIVLVNYRLGLDTITFKADGSLDLSQSNAVNDFITGVLWALEHAEELEISTEQVLLGGHSVGATVACLLSVVYQNGDISLPRLDGVFAASPILEPGRTAERQAFIASEDANDLYRTVDEPYGFVSDEELLKIEGQLFGKWLNEAYGYEVLGLFRPTHPSLDDEWISDLARVNHVPIFISWARGEYGEYGLSLLEKAKHLVNNRNSPRDHLKIVGDEAADSYDARQLHRLGIPYFFGNVDKWASDPLRPFLWSDDFSLSRGSFLEEVNKWLKMIRQDEGQNERK